MIDEVSGQAVGLIDLDTVKPGLIHTTLETAYVPVATDSERKQ